MHQNRIIGLVLALTMLASACFGGSGDSSTDPNPPGSDNLADISCDGGAFPNDPDFRQLLCDTQNAELEVLASNGDFDPAWGPRLSGAILKQATDRPAAVAELEALIGEMNAAG